MNLVESRAACCMLLLVGWCRVGVVGRTRITRRDDLIQPVSNWYWTVRVTAGSHQLATLYLSRFRYRQVVLTTYYISCLSSSVVFAVSAVGSQLTVLYTIDLQPMSHV